MPLSRGADGEVVWSSRPDAGAKFCGHHPRSDGGRKGGHRGEREGNRKTIAQGKPDDPVEPVVLPPCFLLHGTHGCNRHPAFLLPSNFKRAVCCSKTRARCAGENAGARRCCEGKRIAPSP